MTTAPINAGSSDFERRVAIKKESSARRSREPAVASPMGSMFDRQPPHSVESERGLLGAMIIDGRVIAEVMSVVKGPEAFYSEAHAAIYSAIVSVADRHSDIDPVLLEQHLRSRNELDRIGGSAYLAELAAATPGSANALRYARIVTDKHRLRKLIDAAGEILFDTYQQGHVEGDECKKLVDEAESRIFEIAQDDIQGEIESMSSLMQREIDVIRLIEGGYVPDLGVKTGFHDLDKMLGGLQGGELIILAARPSMGKTALALNLAEQIATGRDIPSASHLSRTPKPVGLFSLEMGKNQLAQRWLSAWSGVDSQRIRAGTLNSGKTRHGYVEEMDEYKRLIEAALALADAPLFVDDTAGLSLTSLRARARRMRTQYKVECIMIDYLQLLSSPQQARESRQVEVSAISRGVKALARELGIPIIALSQLNRGPEGREGNRPRMSDLRESGSLEQDADAVLLLHREEYFHKGDPAWDVASPSFDENNRDKIGTAEIIIAKQRNGPTGVVHLTWDSNTTRFRSHASAQPADIPSNYQPYAPDPAPNYNTPQAGYDAPAPAPAPRSSGWHAGRQSGPVSNHRDGGGPDRDQPTPSRDPFAPTDQSEPPTDEAPF